MTIICLIRHGETDWNNQGKYQGRADIDINGRGHEQSRRAAIFLQDYHKWDLMISSPLKRAKSTANIIGDHLGIDQIVEMFEFIEEDCGMADGLTKVEVEARFGQLLPPGSETRAQVIERGKCGLAKIMQDYRDKSIIIITHGHVIRSILMELTTDKDQMECMDFQNTSMNVIKHYDGRWSIDLLNSIEHLRSEFKNV